MKMSVVTAAAIAELSISVAPAHAQAQFKFFVTADNALACTFDTSQPGRAPDMQVAVGATQTIRSSALRCSGDINNLAVSLAADNGKLLHQSNASDVYADYSVRLATGATTTREYAAALLRTAQQLRDENNNVYAVNLKAGVDLVFTLTARITDVANATRSGAYLDTMTLTIG